MGDEKALQSKRLAAMTTDQLAARIAQHQQEINLFIEQLELRAHLQEYAEQQCDELLTLIEDALAFLEEMPPLSSRWAGRRDDLIARFKRKL